MRRLDFKSHDPFCITYFHIYDHAIGQMTGVPTGVSECGGPFHFMPVDTYVVLHTWLIYRQLAGGSVRCRAALLKLRNKGCMEADFFLQENAWNGLSN